jgi:hypothetical protein
VAVLTLPGSTITIANALCTVATEDAVNGPNSAITTAVAAVVATATVANNANLLST